MLVLFVLLGFLGLAVAIAAAVLAMKYKGKAPAQLDDSNDEDLQSVLIPQDDTEGPTDEEPISEPGSEPSDLVPVAAEPQEVLVDEDAPQERETDPENLEVFEMEDVKTTTEEMTAQRLDDDLAFDTAPESPQETIDVDDANLEGSSKNSSALEHWLAQEHQDEIMDFTVWDERLMIVYDDQSEEDPIVMLERDCVVPDRQYVVMNGVRIAAVDNAGDLTLDHIVLVGQSMLDGQIAA